MATKKATSKSKTNKVTSGVSGLVQPRKLNKWVILIAVLLFATVGAFLVGRSFATSNVTTKAINGSGLNCNMSSWHENNRFYAPGSRGDCVKLLQRGLIATGFLSKQAGADGIFGSKTASATRSANNRYLYKNTDVAGYCTIYALNYATHYGAGNVASVRKALKIKFGKACV